MKCSQCKNDKLSKEFPSNMITERCNHIPSYCLSCLIKNLDLANTTDQKIRKCPECSEKLSEKELRLISLAWDRVSFKIDVGNIGKAKTTQSINAADGNNNMEDIYVVLLNGQKCRFRYNQIKNIPMLRKEIRKKLGVDESKQKLIYNGVELQDQVTTPCTLQDYKIEPGSHIQLIIELYGRAYAESINSLIFDLFWGYPGSIDYLEGSCLLYKGDVFFRKYDNKSVFYPSFPHIKHSGSMIDDANKRGHERITAKLDTLPPEVTQLYFVLSTFKSPTIGHFKDPGFKLIDETQPDKPLCTYQLEKAADSQAVIMCCVSRVGQGMWEVIEIGKLSPGNVEDYDPIERSIAQCSLFDKLH
ncbi:uncharacterized protein OCT59_008414 [Rhizophagus irregularis]|uniref:Uncharacterized protein n=2 Tax=Rhizophagus irregularis TaxID=588596 RepID=A0A015J7F7_RHIIW|nr:hypothetical protein GLOIN_2v1781663 [Rhizophagus irregularis DAOM 181602=DAOM 197198]EXX62735.1 hypothetical protein RirG_158980 [Rhizophagus irregularis DAOM 197198w]UZO17051.1 hypothetical protein OCT59_008414 [Rhizophagus irregularis]POG65513.1 hypothetical protein GLOIN_2v1781663 [Rhizophagus irregularis DAOM 181602=DAOM 197198]CAG8678338.1 20257_t:CDS:2 [Rhizophagus irregularis]GBC27937.1 hypothetical protein RIR_jg2208.t1 [Rhizophagus irregularis DAOM 181602=DAOM 197198]|eukprot:XP_025172379.1 hypothetical protein GLOIN_2v1781663 [Rhizophagus irregularis DAOM 181602=DAOM 197198]